MRKDIGLVGVAVLSGWLLGFAPGAVAADYSVRFGELQGTNHNTVVPAGTIKMCDKSTGYKFGYEIIPSGGDSYEYYTILHLPAPPATIIGHTQAINEGGKEIRFAAISANGRAVEEFSFDQGDPLGAWAIDVVVQNAVVSTIKFNVVPANACP